MIFLYILLALTAVIFLLLLFPVIADISYAEELSVTVRYLFFKYQIVPKAEPPKKKSEVKKKSGTKKQNEPKDETADDFAKIMEIIKIKGFRGFLELIKEIVIILGKSGWSLLKHVRLKDVDVYVCVGAEDPADAAILYGNTCSIVYPSFSYIQEFFKSADGRITVDLDYGRNKPLVDASGSAKVKALFILKEALVLLKKLIPYVMEFVKVKN